MTPNVLTSAAEVRSQPHDTRRTPSERKNDLVISTITIGKACVVVSTFGNSKWRLQGAPANRPEHADVLNFNRVPESFRLTAKELFYRYIRKGRAGFGPPASGSIKVLFGASLHFFRFLEKSKISRLQDIPSPIFIAYVNECKSLRQSRRSVGNPLSSSALATRFTAIEALFELSHFTQDVMQHEPWPGTCARYLSGMGGPVRAGLTPLIPDTVFCKLFQEANKILEEADFLISLRDDLLGIDKQHRHLGTKAWGLKVLKKKHLVKCKYLGTEHQLDQDIRDIRTAAYIILASTSGCRNHELANLQNGCYFRTVDEDGKIFHWMRSKSEKQHVGTHDWMVPAIAIKALRIMERWALPYQRAIANEIKSRITSNPLDPQIVNATKQKNMLFLKDHCQTGYFIRVIKGTSWNLLLKRFSQRFGLEWDLASHQFRRKFANYAAHSKFGDLRYLREHYAHCSMDMTLGYALDNDWGVHLDSDLYEEIDIELNELKRNICSSWFAKSGLAGGLGSTLTKWKRDPENLAIFKTQSDMIAAIISTTPIRSNGHAWCTADDRQCIGNTLEKTRCSGCDQGLIDDTFIHIYQHLESNLEALLDLTDIGDSGRAKVKRDLDRYRQVIDIVTKIPSD